jgi:hypothetical protein
MKLTYLLFLLGLMANACREEEPPAVRGYYMGFQNSGPRITLEDFQKSLNIWTPRADAAMITTEVPWKDLLNGQTEVAFVKANYETLVQFYRAKGFKLWVYIDPQNGLDRTRDATELVNRGRSIAEPQIQAIYRRFTVVMDSILKPEHIGLALETNLIRTASTPAIYEGVKQAAHQAAADLRSRQSLAKLSISIQAEDAWGKLSDGAYKGITQDFVDFPFVDEMGISSYPYLSFDKPSHIPDEYYSRLFEGKTIPRFVSEGGWSSASIATSINSPEEQADYIERHDQLLQSVNATAVFQLLFTDIDITQWPPPIPENLPFFTSIGLMDTNFQAKPALTVWDKLFARKKR